MNNRSNAAHTQKENHKEFCINLTNRSEIFKIQKKRKIEFLTFFSRVGNVLDAKTAAEEIETLSAFHRKNANYDQLPPKIQIRKRNWQQGFAFSHQLQTNSSACNRQRDVRCFDLAPGL